jgi:hypothetical protein
MLRFGGFCNNTSVIYQITFPRDNIKYVERTNHLNVLGIIGIVISFIVLMVSAATNNDILADVSVSTLAALIIYVVYCYRVGAITIYSSNGTFISGPFVKNNEQFFEWYKRNITSVSSGANISIYAPPEAHTDAQANTPRIEMEAPTVYN